MKSSVEAIIGIAMSGGFYAGRIKVGSQTYALIVAPKAEGEHADTTWHDNYNIIEGAKHYDDGLANTNAMAETGSTLAKWARDLRIAGHDDWYLPSQDELEIIYRNLKPTTQENSCYLRSGINLSAIEPTRPYTGKFPLQTQANVFQQGGAEAFEADLYWTSTQRASINNCAWSQSFGSGNQYNWLKNTSLRARAVRRLVVE